MSVSHISLSSNFEDENIGSSASYVILIDSELAPLVEALASPDYYSGSDIESKPSEANSEESVGEDASEEDHSDDDIPEAVAPSEDQVTPTLPAEPAPAL
ncbi:hypothetical protein Tco_0224029 [Tanacetum coccineum]